MRPGLTWSEKLKEKGLSSYLKTKALLECGLAMPIPGEKKAFH